MISPLTLTLPLRVLHRTALTDTFLLLFLLREQVKRRMDTFSAETFGGKRYALNVCSLTLLFIALTLPLSARPAIPVSCVPCVCVCVCLPVCLAVAVWLCGYVAVCLSVCV